MRSFKVLIFAALLVLVLAGKKKGRVEKHRDSHQKGDEKGSESSNYNVAHGNSNYGPPPSNYGPAPSNYGPAPSNYAPIPIRVINYGPDNAKYRYSAPFYDHYVKQHANVQFNRFPGGVDYNHNVNGYGADVKVSFQSFPSQNAGYSHKG